MNLFQQHPKSPIATPASFSDLYECNRLSVFRYIYGLTGGPQDDVEDLVAQTFLRAWKARHRFDGTTESATGWLIRIAKRLVIDEYRRTLQAARFLPVEPPAGPSAEQSAISDEQKTFLFNLLAGLPDGQREILVLRYMLGWRVNDIASHMGTTENTISVTIHRTLFRLREQWLAAELESPPTLFVQKELSHESHS
jgi:RNA polymerase sigma-70 factor (ECF subfamily)